MRTDQLQTLILLHGFTTSSNNWQRFIPALSEQFQLITPDIVGHGNNVIVADISQYHMLQAAEAILSTIDEPFHLLGYSMGGRLALYIATHYPQKVKSLILESASPGLKTEAERQERKKRDDTLADKIEANGIEWFVDYWESISLWDSQQQLPDDVRQKLRKQRQENHTEGLANSLRGMGTGVMPSLWDKLAELPMPVKLIAGELDTKFVSINQEMTDLIPDTDLSIVKEAGHTVHLEKPEAFTKLVLQFLKHHS
jgi:2-succinyl-6-hydroxy-2,4-cyclohexadiene-1-carboxylate synthase